MRRIVALRPCNSVTNVQPTTLSLYLPEYQYNKFCQHLLRSIQIAKWFPDGFLDHLRWSVQYFIGLLKSDLNAIGTRLPSNRLRQGWDSELDCHTNSSPHTPYQSSINGTLVGVLIPVNEWLTMISNHTFETATTRRISIQFRRQCAGTICIWVTDIGRTPPPGKSQPAIRHSTFYATYPAQRRILNYGERRALGWINPLIP